MIVLASASPRRIEMLINAGYDPVVRPASITESLPFEMAPDTATMYLALSKAFAVADDITDGPSSGADWPPPAKDAIIVAADTVVVHNGKIIGKPSDPDDAFATLRRLRASSHHVITGCCVCRFDDTGQRFAECFYEDTTVYFGEYTDSELRAYVETDEPYDKAGGYAIQGSFGKYIDHIDGDFDNVVGLPLTRVRECIERTLAGRAERSDTVK